MLVCVYILSYLIIYMYDKKLVVLTNCTNDSEIYNNYYEIVFVFFN